VRETPIRLDSAHEYSTTPKPLARREDGNRSLKYAVSEGPNPTVPIPKTIMPIATTHRDEAAPIRMRPSPDRERDSNKTGR
jgi:hypothetical protein